MNTGFTIKCNKCGKETIYTENMNANNKIVLILVSGYEGQQCIACDCGNEVENK